MSLKIRVKDNARIVSFALVFATLLGTLASLGYYEGEEIITRVYGFFATLGHFFILLWILVGIPCLVVSAFSTKRRIFLTTLASLLVLVTVALVSDILVFAQYRFHINGAMVDLFFNAGDTIAFSLDMWLQIVGIVAGISLFCFGVVYFAIRIAKKFSYSHLITASFIGLFVATELIYMVSFATYQMDLVAVKNTIPLFQPLTANRFLKKIGLKNIETPVKVASGKKGLCYPLIEPSFSVQPQDKHQNIVFLLADSLRGDVFTSEIMPKTYAWAQNEICLTNHFSSSNSTRSGIFGLFYSLPPHYWHAALATRTPPVFITTLQKMGYDIKAFTTATLDLPEFTDTVFATVRPIRLQSEGATPVERDINSVEDFEKFLQFREDNKIKKPFFAFIFIDTTHGYTHPKEFKKFLPAWDNPKYLKLTNEIDSTPLMNLYKNSAGWTDELFSRVIKSIEKHHLMNQSIIMISSDHGQEINDSKKNFWGHNSAYNDAQTHIPGILHWPGKSPYKEEQRTVVYDIPMTILRHELGMTSSLENIGIGYDLFDNQLQSRQWLLMGGYSNVAIKEKNRIIEIDELGLLKFYDNAYNKHSDTRRTPNILEAFDLMSKYHKRTK